MRDLEDTPKNNQKERNLGPFFQTVKNLFNGRIGRVDFYLAMMMHGIAIVGLGWLLVAIYGKDTGGDFLISILLSLVLTIVVTIVIISFLSLIVRRLHDVNSNGWKFFLAFIPIVNIFFVLYLLLYPGSRGGNAYGRDCSNDKFLNVLLNRPSAIPPESASIVSKKRQIIAFIVLVLHVVFLFILI